MTLPAINLAALRQTWFGNIRGDTLAGLVVALALIPEAIAFSIIAGVDPAVGLYASFAICVVIASDAYDEGSTGKALLRALDDPETRLIDAVKAAL